MKFRTSLRTLLLSASVASVALVSCKKDEPLTQTPSGYQVPTTYTFENIAYTGQTQRLSMLDELTAYMKTGNSTGGVVDAAKLKNMYANSGSPFADTTLNTSGKQLKNKTFEADRAVFESYFDSLAAASTSTTPGSNGVAGIVVSAKDPSKKYLFDRNGIEYTQLVEKGLMGAVFYYQATSVYLENIVTDDNATVKAGEGTAMQHHWDEAFGYLGVPTDFPSNVSGVKYWGKYCNNRNAILSVNATLMNAFIKGRAAINNKDYTSRDAARTTIRDTWETICAATAINYLNSAKKDITDDAIRNHALSECIGFIKSLKYSPSRKITDAQIQQALDFIGSNLYNTTAAGLDNARNLISTIYGLDNVKDTL
jgi:hypothetical protein